MYSELVDQIVTRSRRTDKAVDAQAYVRSTLRECQVLGYFHRDLVEDVLTASSAPFIWEYPRAFRTMRTAYYVTHGVYAKFVLPGKVQEANPYYYYGGNGYIAFKGAASQTTINVAYYRYAARLQYYDVGSRPAVFDEGSETWSYLQADGVTYGPALADADEELEARNKVTHWLLDYWPDLIQEGALAKLYQNIDSTDKQRACYALYKSQQKDLISGEVFESIGR